MWCEMLNDLSLEEAHRVLDYDPETGVLRWKPRQEAVRGWNTRYAGRAISARSRGGIRVHIHKKSYLACRLIWLLVYKTWPDREIDHINGDNCDNRITNLRLATRTQNMCNIAKRSDNSSGFKGVSPYNSRWVAGIRINKKRLHLGTFSTPEEAYAAYCKAAERYHGEFARYA